MKFLSNLPKLFVNSAVRQVGRDGGKVISNKIYKGKHGTPIYRTGSTHSSKSAPHTKSRPHVSNRTHSYSHEYQEKPIRPSKVDMSVQPLVKNGGVDVVIKGLLIQLIPIIGTLAVLFKGISYFFTKTTNIYTKTPNRVPDRRYKEGYRIDGASYVKTEQVRYLSDFERKRIQSRGISYLVSIALFVLIALGIRFLS